MSGIINSFSAKQVARLEQGCSRSGFWTVASMASAPLTQVMGTAPAAVESASVPALQVRSLDAAATEAVEKAYAKEVIRDQQLNAYGAARTAYEAATEEAKPEALKTLTEARDKLTELNNDFESAIDVAMKAVDAADAYNAEAAPKVDIAPERLEAIRARAEAAVPAAAPAAQVAPVVPVAEAEAQQAETKDVAKVEAAPLTPEEKKANSKEFSANLSKTVRCIRELISFPTPPRRAIAEFIGYVVQIGTMISTIVGAIVLIGMARKDAAKNKKLLQDSIDEAEAQIAHLKKQSKRDRKSKSKQAKPVEEVETDTDSE